MGSVHNHIYHAFVPFQVAEPTRLQFKRQLQHVGAKVQRAVANEDLRAKVVLSAKANVDLIYRLAHHAFALPVTAGERAQLRVWLDGGGQVKALMSDSGVVYPSEDGKEFACKVCLDEGQQKLFQSRLRERVRSDAVLGNPDIIFQVREEGTDITYRVEGGARPVAVQALACRLLSYAMALSHREQRCAGEPFFAYHGTETVHDLLARRITR